MADVIKTIESWRDGGRVRGFLREGLPGGRFLFNVGRARPKQPIEQLWFTFRGRILGSLAIDSIEENIAPLAYEYAHEWDPPYWGAARFLFVSRRRFHFLRERVLHRGFRGWRYFDLEKYRGSCAHATAREDANMERILSAKSACPPSAGGRSSADVM